MPLAILTKRKELHGFLFLCIRVVPFSIIMGLRLAALRAAGAPLITHDKISFWICKMVLDLATILGFVNLFGIYKIIFLGSIILLILFYSILVF